MLKKPVSAVILLLLFVAAVSAIGQSLMTSEPQTTASMQSIPTRGMTMEYVEANFGSPASKRDPVGDPPITRWEYQSFIVYFEYKRVIHSVSKHSTLN